MVTNTIFLHYKTVFFQNNHKNLDPSCKMDLDLGDCLGNVKLLLLQIFKELISLFEVIKDRR